MKTFTNLIAETVITEAYTPDVDKHVEKLHFHLAEMKRMLKPGSALHAAVNRHGGDFEGFKDLGDHLHKEVHWQQIDDAHYQAIGHLHDD